MGACGWGGAEETEVDASKMLYLGVKCRCPIFQTSTKRWMEGFLFTRCFYAICTTYWCFLFPFDTSTITNGTFMVCCMIYTLV